MTVEPVAMLASTNPWSVAVVLSGTRASLMRP